MKNFTFLFGFILISSMAIGQSRHTLQKKVEKLQESYARISKYTPPIQLSSAYSLTGKNISLKNALAVQKLDSVLFQDYVSASDSWANVAKDSYMYDGELNNTEWLEQDWNETTREWEDYSRVEIVYDENNHPTEMNMYYLDETSGELVREIRVLAYYNTDGRLDSVFHYYTEDQVTWVPEARMEFNFNESGQLIQMDFTVWEEDEETVLPVPMRYIYSYNDQNLMAASSLVILYEGEEFTLSETVYFYDGTSGRRSASEYSGINYETFILEKMDRTVYEYHATGDVSVETTSYWDEDLGDWVEDGKDEYTYSDISFSEVIFPSYLQLWGINEETNIFNNAPTEIITYSLIDGNWNPTEKTTFYYSEGTSTYAGQIAEARVSVFPNPFSSVVTFTWSGYNRLSLEVYNISGVKIMDKQIHPGMEVPVSGLNRGVYLYRLLNNNQTVQTGKILKK